MNLNSLYLCFAAETQNEDIMGCERVRGWGGQDMPGEGGRKYEDVKNCLNGVTEYGENPAAPH